MDVAKYYNDGYDVEVPEDDDFDLEYIDLDEVLFWYVIIIFI